MTIFWVSCGMLLAGALVLLVTPLLRASSGGADFASLNVAVYGDQLRELEADAEAGALGARERAAARREIARRLADERGVPEARSVVSRGAARATAVALVLLVPLAAVLLYHQWGRPDAMAPSSARVPVAADAGHALGSDQVALMVTQLAARLRERPDDPDGWHMLARSYTVLGRYRDAALAYERFATLRPPTADVLADHADVVAMAQGKRFAGEPTRLVARALELDAGHVKALSLAGTAAMEAKDFAGAAHFWERVVRAAPPDSPFARSARGSLVQVERILAGAPAGGAAAGGAAAGGIGAGAPPATIAGTVRLSPELAARVSPDDTVFVFARQPGGKGMPVAIVRRSASELPFEFVLDDGSAMGAGARLSAHREVALGVRVSRSGSATGQPGDLLGAAEPVRVGARDVAIVIDRIQAQQ